MKKGAKKRKKLKSASGLELTKPKKVLYTIPGGGEGSVRSEAALLENGQLGGGTILVGLVVISCLFVMV